MKTPVPIVVAFAVTIALLGSAINANAWNVLISKTNVSCFGSTNGVATANVTGNAFASAFASFQWSTGATTKTITGLAPGTYSVTVTSLGSNKMATTQITQPPLLAATINSTSNCGGLCNGSAYVSISGGTSPYTLQWSNGATGYTLNNLCAGTYWLTVTDAKGCKRIVSMTITPVAVSVSTTPVSCVPGTATAVISGGPVYSVQWSNWGTGTSLTGLAAGNYTVTVYGANGCSTTATGTVGTAPPLALNAAVSGVMCENVCNGIINQTTSGGMPPYSYQWSTGAVTEDINNLCVGNYSATVVDAVGCTASQTYSVGTAPMTANVVITDNGCGAASANTTVAGGGTGPFLFQWSTGAQTPSISNITPGTHSVTVTHAGTGCTAVGTNTYNGPLPLTLSVTATNVVCAGSTGSAAAAVNGGTVPYTFNWSNGSTGSTVTGLLAGSHAVTVTDANGCVATSSFVIVTPVPMIYTVTPTHNACVGYATGSATLNVSGGFAPYYVVWSNGVTGFFVNGLAAGNYCATVTDANGCTVNACAQITDSDNPFSPSDSYVAPGCDNECTAFIQLVYVGGNWPYSYKWSTGSTAETLLNLCQGEYTVTASDANGCTLVETFSVVNYSCSPLSVNVAVTHNTCFGGCNGSATAAPQGGIGPYVFFWSNGATTPSVAGLCAGQYSVTVHDSNSASATTTIVVAQPTLVTLNISLVPTLCGECSGAAMTTVTGGTAPYAFLWSNGANTASISGLCSGVYSVTVADANGCLASASGILSNGCRIETVGWLDDVQLTPNPTTGMAVLSFTDTEIASCTVVLTDMLGRELKRNVAATQSGVNTFMVDLSTYADGLYFVRMKRGDHEQTFRLFKQ